MGSKVFLIIPWTFPAHTWSNQFVIPAQAGIQRCLIIPWAPPTPGKKALLAQGPLASPKGSLGCQPLRGTFDAQDIQGRSNGPSLARLDLNPRPCGFTPNVPPRLSWLQGERVHPTGRVAAP